MPSGVARFFMSSPSSATKHPGTATERVFNSPTDRMFIIY